MEPIEASKKGAEKKCTLIFFPDVEVQIPSKNKFSAGDLVGIIKSKGVFFLKDYPPNYTTEIFQIATAKHTTSIMYEL
jgi:hypothetical protein